MQRRRQRALLLLATMTFVAGGAAAVQPASAGEPAPDPAATPLVSGEPLDEYLAHFPEAIRLLDGSYQLEPGRPLVPPAKATEAAEVGINAPPWRCDVQYFCLWGDSDFSGWIETFYYCRKYSLYGHSNQTSSMYNAQGSYTATFWDTDSGREAQGKLRANNYLRNLAWDLAPDGGNWNDRIDQVKPC
jgi:hypothetical protein